MRHSVVVDDTAYSCAIAVSWTQTTMADGQGGKASKQETSLPVDKHNFTQPTGIFRSFIEISYIMKLEFEAIVHHCLHDPI